MKPPSFGPVRKDPPDRNGRRLALSTRRDGIRIKIGYKTSSFVHIETGYAKGEVHEGRPAGTEVVPERLRTTGRHEDDDPPETWVPHSPPDSPNAAPTDSFVITQTRGKE